MYQRNVTREGDDMTITSRCVDVNLLGVSSNLISVKSEYGN